MIVVIYEANGQTQVDAYTSPQAKVYNKGGFIEVKEGNETIASYNPTRFIAARVIKPRDLVTQQAPIPGTMTEPAPEPEAARNDNAEPLHPGDGAKEQQPSSGG